MQPGEVSRLPKAFSRSNHHQIDSWLPLAAFAHDKNKAYKPNESNAKLL